MKLFSFDRSDYFKLFKWKVINHAKKFGLHEYNLIVCMAENPDDEDSSTAARCCSNYDSFTANIILYPGEEKFWAETKEEAEEKLIETMKFYALHEVAHLLADELYYYTQNKSTFDDVNRACERHANRIANYIMEDSKRIKLCQQDKI